MAPGASPTASPSARRPARRSFMSRLPLRAHRPWQCSSSAPSLFLAAIPTPRHETLSEPIHSRRRRKKVNRNRRGTAGRGRGRGPPETPPPPSPETNKNRKVFLPQPSDLNSQDCENGLRSAMDYRFVQPRLRPHR